MYELAQPGLGERFIAAVIDAIERIQRTPAAWAVWPGARPRPRPLRRFVMARFPYGIGYQLRPTTIVVVVIAHARRRPP